MRKFFAFVGALLACSLTTPSFAQVPGIAASVLDVLKAPQCTTKMTPYPATYYPKVVYQTDSIGQHANVPGLQNATTNTPSLVASFTTTNTSPIVLYNGADLATLAPYTNQGISGTGLSAGTLVLQALDSTHLLLSTNATSSATNNLTLTLPQNGAQTQWNLANATAGEITVAQAMAPYFRVDEWNDLTRNWGAIGNTAAMMRGSNLGYSGANTLDLLPRGLEYQLLDPDILIFAVGVNNITSATFQNDIALLVDRAHAWCPTLPIFLANVRATGAGIVSSRQTGGIVYDNTLIAAVVAARPWLKAVDLFTPYANNASPSAGVAIAGVWSTISGNAFVTWTGLTGDMRQLGPQVGQTVTGAPITGSPTIASVAANGFTLSSGAAVTSTASNQSLTFTPFASANQTGIDANYSVTYPANSGDGLHPSTYGAQIAGAPAMQTAICSVIVGNCAASTTHNVFLDNVGASMLTTNPASLLTGTAANINKSVIGTSSQNQTGTWTNGASSMTVVSATGISVGQIALNTTGLASNTIVTAVAGTTISFSPPATAAGTSLTVTFSTPNVTTTGTWSNTGTTVTVASATGITKGQLVASASGFQANTYVTNVSGLTITFAPAANGLGAAQSVSFSAAVSGQNPQGIDLATGSATLTSYTTAVSANSETGGNMQTITLSPSGSANTENLTWRPSGIALASTLCVSAYCQMWFELEVDQNPGWVSVLPKATERLAAYSNNYYAQGAHGIIPQGSGTRRFWSHTECFPYPFNSSGHQPSLAITHSPSLDTGNPVIVVRRWDIRKCDPTPSRYKVQN